MTEADLRHLRQLVGDIEQWLPCMSYNDSYFGEPPGQLKRTVRELADEVEALHLQVATSSSAEPTPPLDLQDLVDLEEKIRMMERAGQIIDPNVRLPLKFLLEQVK